MKNILSKSELSELERLNKVASPAHWIPLDLSQALKKNEDIVLIVELRNKAGRLIDMAKQLLHTEKWYAIRLRQLRDLCEKHNLLTEFCNIVANGKENHTAPPTYQNIVNQLEYELEQYKKKERYEIELNQKEEEIDNLRDLLHDCVDHLEGQFDAEDNIVMIKRIRDYLNKKLDK
jgi:hypothetical protein